MSLKILYVNIFLIILLTGAKTQENDAGECSCDTEEDKKHKQDLWDWLKKLEAEDVTDEEKTITPGYLHQFDCKPCNDEEKMNSHIMTMAEFEEENRRQEEKAAEVAEKVRDVETGEEVTKEESERNTVEEISDKRCPKGTVWITEAKTCLPEEDD